MVAVTLQLIILNSISTYKKLAEAKFKIMIFYKEVLLKARVKQGV